MRAILFDAGNTLLRMNYAAIAEHLPDVMELLLEFLRTGNTAKLPARVTLPIPKFAVPDFPPPAAKSR